MSIPALVTLWLALASVAAFAATYAVLAPWSSTRYGRNLMANAAAVGALLVLIVLEVLLDEYPGRDVAHVVVLASIGAVFVRRIFLLVRAQRNDPEARP